METGRRKIVWTAAVVAVLVLACDGAARAARPRREWIAFPKDEVARAKNPHEHQGKLVCAACHLEQVEKLKSDPVALCQGCHTFHAGNHPVNVSPKASKEPNLPLSSGRIVCHTCHDPHDIRARRNGLRLAFNDLCARCHDAHH